MGPILLLEKSTVQGLNPSEMTSLWRYYSPVVCPMLMRELLSNLAKDVGNREETEKRLAALASKVDMPGFYVTAEGSFMAANNLLGVELPMDGRVPMPGGTRVRSKDGRHGVIFDESEESKILRKWQARKFSEDEKELAKRIRSLDLDVDLQEIQKLLVKKSPSSSQFPSMKGLVDWIDGKFFESISNKNHLLCAGASLLSSGDLIRMMDRWEKAGRPAFRRFAPYAYYFYRCTIIYYLGLALGFISTSKKAKTHLDVQYLFYLPFCMVFTSGDTFLKDMFPFFKRENQMFLWKPDLKNDLQQIRDHWGGLSGPEQIKAREELGDYPPDLAGSLTSEVWGKLMRPRPRKKEVAPKLTKEAEKRLMDQVMTHFTGSIRIEDNKSVDSSNFKRYEALTLSERTSLLFERCLEVLGLNNGKNWADVKREISANHVRAIYDFYSDLWRPDTDFVRLLVPDPSLFRVLYLGEIDPHTIVKNVVGSLLYVDQVAIVNPFINPWAINETENPLNQPEQYEADLLKLAYLLILLTPWIENGQVILVPDPTDLNAKFKWDYLKIAERRKTSASFTQEEKQDFKRFELLQLEELLRYHARLPEMTQRAVLRGNNPTITEQELEGQIQYMREERARDPIAINRTFKESRKNVILSRSGAGCELSLILCRLLGAVPFSSLVLRMNEYRRLKRVPSNRWDPLCKILNQMNFSFLDHLDYTLVSDLKSQGYLANFRTFFRQLIIRLNSSPKVSDEEVVRFTSEMQSIIGSLNHEWHAIEQTSRSADGKTANIGKGRLFLDIEEEGYVSTEVDTLWHTYVKGAENRPLVRAAFHLVRD